MTWFRVLVRGEHFKMDVRGAQRYMGFYAARFVRADTPALAREAAVAEVRADKKLEGLPRNEAGDPPALFAEEEREVPEREVPDEAPGLVLFEEAAPGVCAPPCLVIRADDGAFWVTDEPPGAWTATPQALSEGCYLGASVYGPRGDMWRITRAGFERQPTLVDRIFRARELPVRIELEPAPRPALADVAARLAGILMSDNPFTESLECDRQEGARLLKAAATPGELISLAEKHSDYRKRKTAT